jgi:periodic tryptophan protein 2
MGNLVTRGALSGLNDPDDDHFAKSMLPGATGKSQNDGSRNTRPDIRTSAVAFSSTGREWAAATTQGLQVRRVLSHCFLFVCNYLGILDICT